MDDRFLQFTLSLSRLNKRVQGLKTDAMAHLGLKAAHILVLYNLAGAPEGLRFSELCSRCDMDRALVSRTLAELCGLAQVAKNGTPGHYNASYTLTREGAATAERMVGAINRAAAEAVCGVDESDLATFYRVLARMGRNLAGLQADPATLFDAPAAPPKTE